MVSPVLHFHPHCTIQFFLMRRTVSSISGEPTPTPRKVTQFFTQDEPTVVHRAKFKSRPSLIEVTPEGSTPQSSGGCDSSKSFRPYESTGKTSLDSKFAGSNSTSSKSNRVVQRSFENKKVATKQAIPRGSGSHELTTIAEVETVDPEPIPSKSFR